MDNAALEPLTHLADGIGVDNVSLFIGDQIGTSDDNLLRQHKIINVLNCVAALYLNHLFPGRWPSLDELIDENFFSSLNKYLC